MSRVATPEEYEELMKLGLSLRRLAGSILNGDDHVWVISMGPKTDAENEPVMVWSVNGNVFEVDGMEFADESIRRVVDSGESL